MSYPAFNFENRLPSIRVTKDFLGALERYLLKKVVEVGMVDEDKALSCIEIKIEDSLGSERLSSISQFESSRFSDSTSRIEIEFERPYIGDGKRLKIRLNFTKNRLFTSLAISASAPNARELVLGLRDGILRTIEPQNTWHWIFHPNAAISGLIFGGGVILGVQMFRIGPTDPSQLFVTGGFIFVWIYLFLLGTWFPYTGFDSKSAERAGKIFNWLLTGVATFLVFGTLFTMLRRPLLGF
ncbi:MAG: hypothetical protein Q8L65_19055 [Burkholderiales bacterium]|nr:hypothetical protein [Burkholderiales bacterium]